MTREEWRASLPDPIHPAEVVDGISRALSFVENEATDLLTTHEVNTPKRLAEAERDAIKLREGAAKYAAAAPATAWPLSGDIGRKGLAVGLALFDGLDELRRAADSAGPAQKIVETPADAARRVKRGFSIMGDEFWKWAGLVALGYLILRDGGDR